MATKISDLRPEDYANLFTELTVSEQEKLSGGGKADKSCFLPQNAITDRCAWESLANFAASSFKIAGTHIQTTGRTDDGNFPPEPPRPRRP